MLLFIISSTLFYQAIRRYKNNEGCDEWVRLEENIGEYFSISIIYITTIIQIWNVGWNIKYSEDKFNVNLT
uniref:Bestrophin homolog n=1 Tax=Strongyloides papillosus TaxID=174720 RepID=A0A0N5B9D5_STREA